MELRLNGDPFPDYLVVGNTYRPTVHVNGALVIPSSWSVVSGSSTIASGIASSIEFTLSAPSVHTLTVKAIGDFGLPTDAAVTFNAVSQTGNYEAGVKWEKLKFTSGERLQARIIARDSRNLPPSLVRWTLYRNGCSVYEGEGSVVSYVGTSTGVYRLKGTVFFSDSTQSVFDSTAFVDSSSCVKHSLPLPECAGTLVYLGAVYTQTVAAGSGQATELPYKLCSATSDVLLLPGTTHWEFDLDPQGDAVDDEIVVRTKKGNWCLNGLSGGLTGENVGYDYGYMPSMVPAPKDHRLSLTVDVFKVHGITYSGFSNRVRVKCYRQIPNVYRYERCAYSEHVGGQGRRCRRWAALFTEVDLTTDVFTSLNRLGTGTGALRYSTVDVTSVPLMTLSTSGAPNPVPSYSGLFYTDSNLYATYESDGQFDIQAHTVAAIEQVRPCCISLLTFDGSSPLISNRIQRLGGTLSLLLTDGVVFEGSVVYVRIGKADGTRSAQYAVPVTSTCYVNEDNVLAKVGEISVDLSDYQFDETGVVVDFYVDDSAAVQAAIPDPIPTPVTSLDYIYTTTFAHTVAVDGACYTNPQHYPVLDDEDVAKAVYVSGCHDSVCGPSAQYCYTATDSPSESVVIPQPFGFPAPYVAFGSNPARCFQSPAALSEINGTLISTALYTGTSAAQLWQYIDGSLCGYSYAYTACQANYAPCNAYDCTVIVVYPVSSSPHSTIEYSGRCYTYSGSTQYYGTSSVVAAVDVNPVAGCLDAACTQYNASGSVVVYSDTQTWLKVPVRFDYLSYGTAHYGVAAQAIDSGDSGLADGSVNVALRKRDTLLLTATGDGRLMFDVGPVDPKKVLVVKNGGSEVIYALKGSRVTCQVYAGSTVWLRVSDHYGRLPLGYSGKKVSIRWTALSKLPRLYDTVTVAYTGSTSVRALGFCAYTDSGDYTFYGTLPYSGDMHGPVNPDTLVTVSGGEGQEYNLLSVRATGDVNLYPLSALPWYDGESLSGPLTFKFYAARELFGAHGEMDVWLDTNGTFPTYLKAGDFDTLVLNGTNYRKDSAPDDTSRNAYTVAFSAVAQWPNIFVATNGQVISAGTNAGTYTLQGVDFARAETDQGLSYVIYR